MSVRIGRFTECSGVLQTTQFAYKKGLGTCDALLSVSHTLQSVLESTREAKIVHIDCSAAFDRVNHGSVTLYRVTDPLSMFPLLLKRTADVMAPHS